MPPGVLRGAFRGGLLVERAGLEGCYNLHQNVLFLIRFLPLKIARIVVILVSTASLLVADHHVILET